MPDLRNTPIYPVTEASRILLSPPSTIRTWFPPLSRQSLTFIQLVEAYVVQLLRKKHKMKMRAINDGRNWLRQKTSFRYPLAAQNLGLETDGVELFFNCSGALASATKRGQLAMREMLEAFLSRVEYDSAGLAMRFFPFTHGYSLESPKIVVIDPRFNFGRPCLINNSVSTQMIARRHAAGESRADLAEDYRCQLTEIDEAINHEERTARAA